MRHNHPGKRQYFYGFLRPSCYMRREAAEFDAFNEGDNSGRPVRGRVGWLNTLARHVLSILLLVALPLVTVITAHAQTPLDIRKKYDINIPRPLDAATALNRLAEQTDVYLLFPYKDAKARKANPVTGNYTLLEALRILLHGSGLKSGLSENGVLMISVGESPESDQSEQSEGKETMDTKKTILTAAIAYLLSGGSVQEVVAEEAAADATKRDRKKIEEVVITATKRQTNLQDTALAVTAISGEMINKRGITGMGDYLSTVPGVTMQDRGSVGNSIVIRGIAVEPQREMEAVGTYFGNTPISGLAPFTGSGHIDFKMVDIERVEVLRGPQGSLYGSGSMGGTVRVIPVSPDTTNIEGNVSAQYSETWEYGSDNNILKGTINLPVVNNSLALRGVGYRFSESGYVENIAASYTGTGNVSDIVDAWGGTANNQSNRGQQEILGSRLSLLWVPVEKMELSLNYAWQKMDQSGFPEVELYLPGKFEQVRAMPGSASVPALDGSLLDSEEGVKSEIDLIALSLNYSIGWGDISSTTSWLYQNSEVSFDWTRNAAFVGNNWSLTPRDDNYFIQEFQFSSNFNGPLQLLIGAYYEDKKRKSYPVRTFAGDSAKVEELLSSLSWPIPTDAPPGFSYSGWEEFSGRNINTDLLKQHAVYGEISWDITESANFTVGVRHYDYEQSSYHIAVGTIQRRLNPFVQVDVEGENSGESFTANLSWKPNDNTILYLRWAEGFRPGIALQRHSAEFYDPDKTGYYTTLSGEKVPIRNESDPDSLENFEFGFKGVYFDNRLIMNSAIYRIDWEGLPVSVPIINFATGFAQAATTINAGKSISQGIELEVEIILSENFRADFSTSYNDTELAEDRVGLGEKGDNLPGSADFNLTAALEYHFPLAKYDSYVRVDYSYIDEFNSLINQPDSVPLSGGYSQINVKSGIELDNLGIDFFIKNVTNADDISWVTAFSTPAGPTAYRLRPRTIGINFKYSF